ncbi:MAG: hypothetical protein HRT45_19860 [Bdellovibrionales bacterium]|nr:hypothetical protein [Bdellovibrionales bacterium]
MKSFICLVLFLFVFEANSLEINLSFWSKPQKCERSYCLPKSIGESGPHFIEEPVLDSARRLEVPFEEYTVRFVFALRSVQGGYYSFQTEIVDQFGATLALCSRYEKISTMERAPVGACAGMVDSENLLGVTVHRPREAN